MKKILATLLAVMMIATLCVVYVAAWSDGETDAGWTRHHVFDAKLEAADGSDYEIPAEYENGKADGSFQFWKESPHLYQDKGLNVFCGAKVVFEFKGTGIRIGTCYRRPFDAAGFSADDLAVYVDGEDKSSSLKDVASADDNNTAHTIIFEATGLEAGEHTVEFTCTSNSYRYSIDYYEIKDEGKEAPKYDTKLKAVVILPAAEDYTRLDGSPAYWTRFIFSRNWSDVADGLEAVWKLKLGDSTWNCDNDEKVLDKDGNEVDLSWGNYSWGVDEKGNYYFQQLFNPTSELLGDQDLYQLAKEGKLQAFIGDHLGGVEGVIDCDPKATFLANDTIDGIEVVVATVKTSEDYYTAASTGDSLIAVVAVVVAAAAGVVLVKKH